MIRRILLITLAVLVAAGFAVYHFRFDLLAFMITPAGPFDSARVPPAPNYADSRTWLALPDRQDSADVVPRGAVPGDNQGRAPADVFYIHPTTYVDAAGWNGPWNDAAASQLATELGQAAVFNGCCQVYAPYYRQATLAAFSTEANADGRKALALAYGDVERAFRHYLATWNKERPFILAAHSQGSLHLQRLLAQVVGPDPALRGRMIAAYAVGYPLPLDQFDGPLAGFAPCRAMGETGCILTWSSFARDGSPDFYRKTAEIWNAASPTGFSAIAGRRLLCVNPVSFRMDEALVPRQANRGGTVRSLTTGTLEDLTPALVESQCREGILRISEPEPFVFRAMLLPGRDYHIYDYALFWQDIRLDAVARVNAFLARPTAAAPASIP